tara:strand:- start:730 stop:1359 length:630 start_codon:yes stop_codon:yes gene_type:complete
MKSKSISRELSLLILGQMSDKNNFLLHETSLEALLTKALESLTQHWTEGLDDCAKSLETAQQALADTELPDFDTKSILEVQNHLRECLFHTELILNGLSSSIDLPRLLAFCDQEEIRLLAIKRVNLVVENLNEIDQRLDNVMEGWRLKRLPRIDRDILRLAVVDLINLKIPPAVACNEAVELANQYSDEQGRKMINGILRRFQNSHSVH